MPNVNPYQDPRGETKGQNKEGKRPRSPQQRAIRVFISSTFRDMKEERDELVKRVFPQLRKMCEKRGVVWGEVDLRWGITDEQRAEGKVLPICLAEIRECRPYFIGILGERYGWLPDEIPRELIRQEPWLAEHSERSVTELEILHGVLNDPKMADHSFFYFRNPGYVDMLPEHERKEYRELPIPSDIERYGPLEAERRTEERRRKLSVLKDKIRESSLPIRENYANPHELGKLVLEDLTSVIDKLFPEGEQPDPLDREAAEHEAYAQNRFKVYIGRKEYFDILNDHAKEDGPPLVVLGESGSGKSALLSNWAIKYRKKHKKDLFIMHFIGSTPYSADWSAMLRRIMGELKRRFNFEEDIPTEAGKLRLAFANWLHMAAAKGRVVIILDALNQLEDRDGAPDLVWLPPVIPPNTRLILSTLPGRPLDNLQKRGWPIIQVEPLDAKECRKLIRSYLAQYRKSLSGKRIERIASEKQVHNPLYLRALLEELRVFGEHEQLDERIGHYLEAENIPGLYERILHRYEEDYEIEHPALVHTTLSMIWASRRGLSEAELLRILGDGEEPIPHAHWAPFYLAAENMFINRSGLLCFSHDYLNQAVTARYLPTGKEQQSAHMRLADYFGSLILTPRVVDELPWQLAESKAWQRLHALLADLEFFKIAWEKDEYDVKRYWVKVEGNSELRLADSYDPVLKAPEGYLDLKNLVHLAKLMQDTGHHHKALSLLSFLETQFRQLNQMERCAKCLCQQTQILKACGDLDKALSIAKEAEKICRDTDDLKGLGISLNEQGNILSDRGNLEDAMKLYKELEDIAKKLDYTEGIATSLSNQGSILYKIGKIDEALEFYKRVEHIHRESNNPAGIGLCCTNQALILRDKGNLDGARALFEEKERISRALGDRAGIGLALRNQGNIAHYQGDLESALTLYKQAEAIAKELDDPVGIGRALAYQALILEGKNDLDGAMRLYKEAESIFRKLKDPIGIGWSLDKQTSVLKKRGDLTGALTAIKEAELIFRELGYPSGLQSCLGNQAIILKEQGDLPGAKILLKEKEQICRELGSIEGLAESLALQAAVLVKEGSSQVALPFAEEAFKLATEHGYSLLVENQIKPILDEIRSQLESGPADSGA